MGYAACYVHIPFCKQRCNYCDFFSYGASAPAFRQQYAAEIVRELRLHQGQGPLQTLYFGGGTPTVLPSREIGKMIAAARDFLALSESAEVTVEANPATIDRRGLQELRSFGVNRLSLGVQSFHDPELAAMGRLHSSADAIQTVMAAKQAGFENVSLDLIYGLPGQTLAGWQDNLSQAVALGVQHISLYSLSLENDSPWGKRYQQGMLVIPDEDASADMLDLAIDLLAAADFGQYEIANFSLPGYQSQHNSAYWQRLDYLGVGLNASSCQGNHRWRNLPDQKLWQNALAQDHLPPAEAEWLDPPDVIAEAVFLGLRLLEGIDLNALQKRYDLDFGAYYKEEFAQLTAAGLLKPTPKGYALTRRGVFLGNLVFAAFLPEKPGIVGSKKDIDKI